MRRLAAAVAMLVLVGCSDTDAPSAPTKAASAPAALVATARGVVELPAGLFDVLPPQDGMVTTIAVREGDSVRAGQPLLRLADEQQRQDTAVAEAELAVVQARLKAAQARLPSLRQQAQRLAEAVRAEVLEAQRADEARQALQEAESAAEVALAEQALALQKVHQARAAAARLVVNAPMAALVLRVQVQPGARVTVQGRPLMQLMPQGALRVRAELNEAYAQRVKPGMRARVLADGDLPAEGASSAQAARVLRISPVFGGSRLDHDAQPRAPLRVLDCILEFDDGDAGPLRAGQAVRVEILP